MGCNKEIKTRIMKKTINHLAIKLLFLPLIAFMTFTSCQDEVVEITEPNEQETLVANSTLANVMQSTAMRDGSYDNIIDYANCISINLPVTIIVNGIEVTIDSEEDLEIIEAIFDQYSDDEDEVDIIFPITIILNDYTEVVINNFEELIEFAEECAGEDEEDEDIECIDFQYPITISVYNTDFEVIDVVEINDDEELYDFIEDLDGVLASINFPVTMILADGSTVEVNSNAELQAAIEAAEDACDEDDDYDYDDDDNNDIPIDDLTYLLTNCSWSVDDLEVNDEDLGDQYEGYLFTFHVDGTVEAENNGNVYLGTWELIETDTVIKLNLQMETLTDFNNEAWLLHEVEEEDGEFELEFRNGEDELEFEKESCDENEEPDSCSEEQVDSYLAECHWEGDFNGTADFSDIDFYFLADQVLKAIDTENNTETFGTWTTSLNDNNEVVVTIEMPAPLQDFNGEWTVFECDEERIKLINGDNYIVYERECEEETCSDDDVNDYLVECIWNVVSLNGSDDLIVYDLDFSSDGVLLITGNGQTITAQWQTSVTADGVWVLFDGVNGPNIQAISGNWLVTECDDDRLKMFNNNNDFMVIEQECDNAGDCTEEDIDGMLQACPWTISSFAGDNSFDIFNIAFNENQEAVIYTEDESEVYTANWTTSQGTNGVEVTLTEISGGNVQIIEATYVVVECTPGQLILHDVNNSNNELVLDKDCN